MEALCFLSDLNSTVTYFNKLTFFGQYRPQHVSSPVTSRAPLWRTTGLDSALAPPDRIAVLSEQPLADKRVERASDLVELRHSNSSALLLTTTHEILATGHLVTS